MRRPADGRLEGPYGVGLGTGWGTRIPSQLVEPGRRRTQNPVQHLPAPG